MATYTYKDKTYQFENSTKEEIKNLANNFNTLRNSMVNIIETCLYDGLERIPDHYDTLEFNVNYRNNISITFKLRKTKTTAKNLSYNLAQILDSFKAFQIIISEEEHDLKAYSLYGKFYYTHNDCYRKTTFDEDDFESVYFDKSFIDNLYKMDRFWLLDILTEEDAFDMLNDTKRTYTVDNEKYPSVFKINCFDK